MGSAFHGFVAELEVPYFACFRKPASTSVVLTYPVPPFTTILGMIANALGVPRQAYTEAMTWLQKTLRLNLRPIVSLERPSQELAKILKLVGEEREERRPTSFPSSPMHRYFLSRPAYRVFFASHDTIAIGEIVDALRFPRRPLYLGQSDDMVAVSLVWQGKVLLRDSDLAWALVPGFQRANKRVQLLRLPLAFESERRLIYSPLLTLPSEFPLKLPRVEKMWEFDHETVHLFGMGDDNDTSQERAV